MMPAPFRQLPASEPILWSSQVSTTADGLPEFPQADRLGRLVATVDLKERPSFDSATVGKAYEDAVFPWIREVVGETPAYIFRNQRWVQTPQGYLYAPYVQPVWNQPNQPLQELPDSSLSNGNPIGSSLGEGIWAEVTVPYVDVILDKEPSSHSWVDERIKTGQPVRLYYSQVFRVDRIRINDQGQVFYRVNPNYYGGLDLLWAPGAAFRPITSDEIMPIRPDVEDKRIRIDLTHQTLSCYEGDTEVFFCQVSTGAKFLADGGQTDKWITPIGQFRVSRKYISLQMSSSTTGASYDTPGIGWTSIFATGGVAIHSTFWHNVFGDPRSHGCVNCRPEDAKWIFRWSAPVISYDVGSTDVTLTGESSTSVQVYEG